MPLILGIDPGSRQTGYGLVSVVARRQPVYVHSGVVRTRASDLPGRLAEIFKVLNEVIQTHRPDEVAIEQVFLAHNAGAALRLGQARGAAIVAAVQYDLPLFEYSAKQIKQAVVGYGAADKRQMQLMIRHHLQLQHMPQSDEADALGVAWCHGQARANPVLADASASCSSAHAMTDSASAAATAVSAGWRSRGRRGAALRKWAGTRAGASGTSTRSKTPAQVTNPTQPKTPERADAGRKTNAGRKANVAAPCPPLAPHTEDSK